MVQAEAKWEDSVDSPLRQAQPSSGGDCSLPPALSCTWQKHLVAQEAWCQSLLLGANCEVQQNPSLCLP